MEMAEKDNGNLQGKAATSDNSSQASTDINKVSVYKQNVSRNQSRRLKCYRCHGEHYPNRCPHLQSKCYSCNKIGHIQRACGPN